MHLWRQFSEEGLCFLERSLKNLDSKVGIAMDVVKMVVAAGVQTMDPGEGELHLDTFGVLVIISGVHRKLGQTFWQLVGAVNGYG